GAFSETAYEIEGLRLRWLQSDEPVPVMPGGITYIEEGDDEQQRRHLIEAVELLLAGYPSYRGSAAALAADWSRFHSADTLIAMLRRPRESASRRLPPPRFTGREWSGAGTRPGANAYGEG